MQGHYRFRFVSLAVVSLLLFTILGQSALGLPPKPADPVDPTVLQLPPIQLGTSGGNDNDIANGYCCSGTLGALVQIGDKQYILSNTHVLAGDSFQGADNRVSRIGDPITQPGNIDTACGRNAKQVVGHLFDWAEIVPGGTSVVDAAIAEVVPGMVDPDGAILGIGVLSSRIVPTATIFPGLLVKKAGRTTGLTKSYVSAIKVTATITYTDECAGNTFESTFFNQILVDNVTDSGPFLSGGDSGSLLVQDKKRARAVGLLYAGSTDVAIANPIEDVLGHFGATMALKGKAPANTATEETTEDDPLPPGQLAKAIRLQELYGQELAEAVKGVGHGVGAQNGRAVIKVFVEEITPEALAAVPRDIEDVPVVVEAIGKLVAF